MTKKPSTSGDPKQLPKWILFHVTSKIEIARSNKDSVLLEILEIAQGLMRDLSVATELARLEALADCPPRDAIWHLIESASMHQRTAMTKPKIAPSRAKEKLGRLAKKATDLANRIHAAKSLLSVSTDLHYLLDRLQTDDPRGFVKRRRAGLGVARYATGEGRLDLVDLLETFAADLQDEINDFPNRLDAQDGGEDSETRRLTRRLKRVAEPHCGRKLDQLIANIASAQLGKVIDVGRINKITFTQKKQN